MSNFNKVSTNDKTTNLAGGDAYKIDASMELTLSVLTSFNEDKSYETNKERIARIQSLSKEVDGLYLCKLACFARKEFGMRSISHLLATLVIGRKDIPSQIKKDFIYSVVNRVDDMASILSCYEFINKKEKLRLSNSLRKGLKRAFDKFDNYQIAKYKNANKEWSLIDVVNMVHPIPTEWNKISLNQLVNGVLISSDEKQVTKSQLGKSYLTEEEKFNQIKDMYSKKLKLTYENKPNGLGYFELLKSLVNLLNYIDNDNDFNMLLSVLKNEKLIEKSLVLPFRYMSAYTEVKNLNSIRKNKLLQGISDACMIACKNVPKFNGDTCVVLDVSGSMRYGERPAIDPSSILASVLAKSNNSDILLFDDVAEYLNYGDMGIMSIIEKIKSIGGGCTDLSRTFEKMDKKYDRVILMSDMQSWVSSGHRLKNNFKEYKNKFNCNPFVYSFDFSGFGTLEFPEENVFLLGGFSDKIFNIMELCETDKNALFNTINNYNYL